MTTKTKTLLAALPALFATTAGCSTTSTDPSPERHLVLLFTSDEHSHFLSFSPELDDATQATGPGAGALQGGIARRATVLHREREAARAAGKATLTVSAGDNQMGALPQVAFESASLDYGAMVSLGYDVTTLGNHEFDYGPGALARSLSAARAGVGAPPIVASNIHFSDDDPKDDDLTAQYSADPEDGAMIHPYRVITASNGLRVGFVGYVGVDASHVAPNKAPVAFSEWQADPSATNDAATVLPLLAADLQPSVDALRSRENVDLVVALSHAGIADTSDPMSGEDAYVAQNVAGIDVIVSGHAHAADSAPIVVHNDASGRDVVILNASAYGRHVGRIDLTVPQEHASPVVFDAATQALLPVDDRELPDAVQADALPGLIGVIEGAGASGGPSYLEQLLTRVEGMPATRGAAPGDLYFHPLGRTDFDITDMHALLFLAADAELRAFDAIEPADMALESAGVVRGVLAKGKTGVISLADAFNVLPLGASPIDGSPGVPLVRAYLDVVFIRAIFELASTLGRTDSDYDVVPAGVRVDFDCTRPPVESASDLFDGSKGRVRKIWLDSDHTDGIEQFDKLIWDPSHTGLGTRYAVVTSSYIAQFAADLSVTVMDQNGESISVPEAVAHRPDGTEIKELEAFMSYIAAVGQVTIPRTYDPSSEERTSRFSSFAGCP